MQAKRHGTSKWNVHFPFGNSVWEFWSTFKKSRFPEKIPVRGDKHFSCTFHPKFPEFWGKWVTTLMSNHVITPTCDELGISTS